MSLVKPGNVGHVKVTPRKLIPLQPFNRNKVNNASRSKKNRAERDSIESTLKNLINSKQPPVVTNRKRSSTLGLGTEEDKTLGFDISTENTIFDASHIKLWRQTMLDEKRMTVKLLSNFAQHIPEKKLVTGWQKV